LQIVADQKLGEALGSQPTLSRCENAPSARDLVRLNDALLDRFLRLCGQQVHQRGEILLDIDSTDDPTRGQQQFSIFNGAYGQHMHHPMLIFELPQPIESCPNPDRIYRRWVGAWDRSSWGERLI
jgi:DDE family transposase